MIEYQIVFKNTSGSRSSGARIKPIAPQDPNYRETIFRRSHAVNAKNFPKDTFVKIKGTPLRGRVIQTYDDFELVQWDNNRPMYIEVELLGGGNERKICNPSQLKRRKSA